VKSNFKILFLSRASLFTIQGGDTVQILKTAEALRKLNVEIDLKLCNEKNILYSGYKFIHFFNIRPVDMMLHIKKSNLPYVVSTIYVDHAKPAAQKAEGTRDRILNLFSSDAQEYIKTMAKAILGKEKIVSHSYIWKLHRRSVRWTLKNATELLPNSENEYKRLVSTYGVEKKYTVIPNAADIEMFKYCREDIMTKDNSMVLCVARIEQRKNQLNLIKALNGTHFQLYIIGNPAPNHTGYYNECKRISSSNVHFIEAIAQEELVQYYKKAKVHVLPSWFETTGLASLEALFCGCNIVVTQYGDTGDYFDIADFVYCDPESVISIRQAVEQAASMEIDTRLIDLAMDKYNWEKTAEKTLSVYKKFMEQCNY
jgi:glycosyltransferase involved in cell wall biosynthesis